MSGNILNPFKHALLRPDTYIGSIKSLDAFNYVFEDGAVVYKNILFNQGLYNIIREIGSNCIDNNWRSKDTDTPMKGVKVAWNTEEKTLSFWNDGVFIPIEKHTYECEDYRKKKIFKEEMYPAEAHFGEMRAGTNFKDDVERKTSGRNGMGSKCAVIFSDFFIVEHTDSNVGKKFVQKYTNNGKDRTDPKVTSFSGQVAYTKITFSPAFELFGYDIEDEIVLQNFIGFLSVYISEISAVTSLPVQLNIDGVKKTFNFKTFDKYARFFYPNNANKLAVLKLENGDECVIVESYDQKMKTYPKI
jgi:DNA topoisomerase-2